MRKQGQIALPNPGNTDTNSTSIITNVSFPKESATIHLACLTGDADLESTTKYLPKKIGVFQVPRHGSGDQSKTAELYEKIAQKEPDFYLISCGTTVHFDFPHESTITHIYEAHSKMKKKATIILTNGMNLNGSKIGANVDAKKWHDYISIYYWDNVIYADPFLEIPLLPPSHNRIPNTIEWSISGYKEMVAIDLTGKAEKCSFHLSFKEKYWDLKGITNITPPTSPYTWPDILTIILIDHPQDRQLVDDDDPQIDLIFLHKITGSTDTVNVIGCRQTPWNIRYMFHVGEHHYWGKEQYHQIEEKNEEPYRFNLKNLKVL